MRRVLFAAAFLLLPGIAGAQSRDTRADAIDRLLSGQSIRIQTEAATIEGLFVSNRSDSLLLLNASQRMGLSYSGIQRIDVRRPARAQGITVGMLVGAIALGIAGAGEDAGTTLVSASAGLFIGGFLGGLVGGAFHHWNRVYETQAPVDSLSRH